jgi:hypothetical protein
MTIVNLGRVGLVLKDQWNADATYKKLDVVRYQNASYICKAETTTSLPTTTDWQVQAIDGGVGVIPATINFFGDLSPIVGDVRWSPDNTITITQISATVGKSSSSEIIAVIKKNGVVIDTITITASEYKAKKFNLNVVVTDSDYLTADIVQATSGKNLKLTLGYSI